MSRSTSRVGKRETVIIPAALRRRFGIEEGSLVIAEDREEGILEPLRWYSPSWVATPAAESAGLSGPNDRAPRPRGKLTSPGSAGGRYYV
jgi:AbrB family looped-hinge helix DNA binding protein